MKRSEILPDLICTAVAKFHTVYVFRLQDILSFLETRYSVELLDAETIRLHFKNQSDRLDLPAANKDFNLQMTLSLETTAKGDIELADVKVSYC